MEGCAALNAQRVADPPPPKKKKKKLGSSLFTWQLYLSLISLRKSYFSKIVYLASKQQASLQETLCKKSTNHHPKTYLFSSLEKYVFDTRVFKMGCKSALLCKHKTRFSSVWFLKSKTEAQAFCFQSRAGTTMKNGVPSTSARQHPAPATTSSGLTATPSAGSRPN
jgi:hypothetical protein